MPLMDNLLNLYRVDAQARGLRQRVDSARIYLAAQERELKVLLDRKEELQTRVKQRQATVHNLETEIATIDERLEKLRGELNASVNSKQYNAVLEEMNVSKTRRSELEDEALTELEHVTQLNTDIEDVDEKVAERSKIRDVASTQLQERQADVGERLSELDAEREKAASVIKSADLAVFDDQADIHDGEAMAVVEVVSKRHREYTCGACNIQIPFEHVSRLMGNAEQLMQCTACHRILYIEEETKTVISGKK